MSHHEVWTTIRRLLSKKMLITIGAHKFAEIELNGRIIF